LRDAIGTLELWEESILVLKTQGKLDSPLAGRSWDRDSGVPGCLERSTRPEEIDVQYFLARTLELVGQIAEAAALYRRIVQMNPRFKDAAYRAKELSSKSKHPTDGNRAGASLGSWFGHAIESFNQLIGSRK
jgi:hypothetical protein